MTNSERSFIFNPSPDPFTLSEAHIPSRLAEITLTQTTISDDAETPEVERARNEKQSKMISSMVKEFGRQKSNPEFKSLG